MNYEKHEQVVFIKDLLYTALYRWRSILVAALIGALLLGGYVAFSRYQSAKSVSSEDEQQAALAAYEEEKKALINQLDKDIALVTNQEDYIKNSVVMAIDPYCVYQATINFTVQTDYQILPGMTYQNPNEIGAILSAYQEYMSSDEIVQSVADEIGMESKYLWELITLSNGNTETRRFKVTIKYHTADGAQQLLDTFTEHLVQAQKQISQVVGNHTLQILSTSVDERINLGITEQQTAAETRLEDLKEQQKATQEQLDQLKPPAYDNEMSLKKAVFLVILGGILGAGFIACVAWFKHLAGKTVYSARTLTNRTGIKVLGCIPDTKIKNPVDKWLRKAEGRHIDNALVDVAVATVRNYVHSKQRILLFGDCDLSIQQKFEQELKTVGIDATAYGSLLYSAQAQNALAEGDLVLLIEKCGVSHYKNIAQSLVLLEDLNKQLIGCILLDG